MEATNVFRVCYSCDDQRASHDTLCLTLFQDSLALSQVDFIKIDAEAMELDVLKGAGTLLRSWAKPSRTLQDSNTGTTRPEKEMQETGGEEDFLIQMVGLLIKSLHQVMTSLGSFCRPQPRTGSQVITVTNGKVLGDLDDLWVVDAGDSHG